MRVIGRLIVVVGIVLGLVSGAAARPRTYARSSTGLTPKPTPAEAGWGEGPYLLLGLSLMNLDRDINIITGEKFGSDYQLGYAFTVGYTVLDNLAAELMVRLSHAKADFFGAERAEWAGLATLNARYVYVPPRSWLGDNAALLPYVKGGGALFVLGVKGGTENESKVGAIGPGLAFGGGLMLVSGKPGIMVDLSVEEAIIFPDKKEVSGVAITDGKVDLQFSAGLHVGVHF